MTKKKTTVLTVEEALYIHVGITFPTQELEMLMETGNNDEFMARLTESDTNLAKSIAYKTGIATVDQNFSLRQLNRMIQCRLDSRLPHEFVELHEDHDTLEDIFAAYQAKYPHGVSIELPTKADIEKCQSCVALSGGDLKDVLTKSDKNETKKTFKISVEKYLLVGERFSLTTGEISDELENSLRREVIAICNEILVGLDLDIDDLADGPKSFITKEWLKKNISTKDKETISSIFKENAHDDTMTNIKLRALDDIEFPYPDREFVLNCLQRLTGHAIAISIGHLLDELIEDSLPFDEKFAIRRNKKYRVHPSQN